PWVRSRGAPGAAAATATTRRPAPRARRPPAASTRSTRGTTAAAGTTRRPRATTACGAEPAYAVDSIHPLLVTRSASMTNPIGDPGHGHSPAAWTNVLLMMLGVALATVGLFLELPWLLITAGVVFILGPILGLILSKAG